MLILRPARVMAEQAVDPGPIALLK